MKTRDHLNDFESASLRRSFSVRQADVRLSAERPVRVQPATVVRPVTAHDHDYHEISVFLAGEAMHVTRRERRAIRKGDVVVIRPGELHAFDGPQMLEAMNVYYLAEWLDSEVPAMWDEPGMVALFCSGALMEHPGAGIALFSLHEKERALVEAELAQLGRETDRDRPGQAYMKACFLKVATLLARAWHRADGSWQETMSSHAVRRTLWAVEQALEAGEVFSVANAAESVKMSPDRLSQVFRGAVGYPPTEYYQRRRVQRACQLLGNRRMSITDIAMRLGYADGAHLSRKFKEHRGMTPREYREIYVGNS